MNVEKFIKNLYDKKKYIDSYGDCIAITSVIIAIYGLSTGYFYILANSQELKSNWQNIRCDPLYIPFAGIINKPPEKTIAEYTAENFNMCVSKILKESTKSSLSQYTDSNNQLSNSTLQLTDTLQTNRNLLNNVKLNTSLGMGGVVNSMNNFSTESLKPFIYMKSLLNRTLGITTTSLHSILTLKYTFQPTASAIIGLIIAIIIMSIAIIVLSFLAGALVAWIPFIGWLLAMAFYIIGYVAFGFLLTALIVGIPAIILCSEILKLTSI